MDLIKNFNNCVYNNKKKFFIKNNKKNFSIIKKLISLNLIKYVKIKIDKILVYINNNKFKMKFCKNVNIKLKKLKKLKNNIFLINTSKGIMITKENIKLKIGGLLIIEIFL